MSKGIPNEVVLFLIKFGARGLMKFILIAALLMFLAGCGVSIHPLPGVSVHIPIPHDSDRHDHKRDKHDRDDDDHDDRD
jgi:hypothetical protein